jgi:hypothetical protein
MIDKAAAAAVSSAAANADAFAAGIPFLSKIRILSNTVKNLDTFIRGDFLIESCLFMKSCGIIPASAIRLFNVPQACAEQDSSHKNTWVGENPQRHRKTSGKIV